MNNKILHVTWKDENLSEKQLFILNRWVTLNKGIKIKYYTDEKNDKFIDEHFPFYRDVIDKFDRVVMKLDFIRLLYVYLYGGIYADMDVLPLKSIFPLLDLNDVVICEESRENAKNFNTDRILSNSVIVAKPRSNFIKELILDIVSNIDSPKINSNDSDDVLNMTGPLFFNRVYKSYKNKNEVTILDNLYFNPMTFYQMSNGVISDGVQFSYLVHLYDGTWWQKEYNSSLEFIKKIIYHHDITNIKYSENTEYVLDKFNNEGILLLPKISCLCVTKNNYTLLKDSIVSYKNQIYENKELIVVYEEGNKDINKIMSEFNSDDIKYIKVDSTDDKKTLGELRNISINESSGEYICQWDDDDWYHPLRLWEQFRDLKINNKNGSILSSWLVYDNVKNNLLECKRLSFIGWEGSFMYKKSELKTLYPSLKKGEDTTFIENIKDDLSVLYKPELYIYRAHTENTWGYKSIYDRIIKFSEKYSDVLDFNFLKNNHLSTLNNTFGEIMVDNKPFNVLNNNFDNLYDAGIVISVNETYSVLKKMLDSLNNIDLEKNIVVVFLCDENTSDDSKELLRNYDFNRFKTIKIFNKTNNGVIKNQSVGLDILTNDLNCTFLVTLTDNVIVKNSLLEELLIPFIIINEKYINYVITGFIKNNLNGSKETLKGFFKEHNYLENKNVAFTSYLYPKIKEFFQEENCYELIKDYTIENNGKVVSPKYSLVDVIKEKPNDTNEDISYNFHYNLKGLNYILEESKRKNIIPPIIHRVLLYDKEYPNNVKTDLEQFKKYNPNFYTMLWHEIDVLRIMTNEEVDIYTSYVHNIQKSDYARYIILKYFGGIYVDLDILSKKGFYKTYEENNHLEDLFFEEITTDDYFCETTKKLPIRNNIPECNLRISNYFMMSKPHSKNIQKILDLCKERKDLEIKEDYDILYTTGPDVVSEVFDKLDDKPKYLTKNECDEYFIHNHVGHWRKSYNRKKGIKISVVMQSYLGDYPGSRSEPERKFIRAVNSFLEQTNKNTELIVISDNCKITEKLYNENYKENDRVKFKLYESNSKKMYEKDSETINYVGEPRQIGVDMTEGDIITYMDSDDFLTKNYLEILLKYWEFNSNLDWIINKCWWDNEVVLIKDKIENHSLMFDTQISNDTTKIEGLDSSWVRSFVKHNLVLQSPGLISHKKTCDIKWTNVTSEGDMSEDILFYNNMLDKYKNGKYIYLLGYVRCHLKNGWDF